MNFFSAQVNFLPKNCLAENVLEYIFADEYDQFGNSALGNYNIANSFLSVYPEE